MGGCGICVSPQLGHLPDAGGGPQCPRRWEEPPSNWVGRGGKGGGTRSGGWTGPAPLRGGWEKGGVTTPGGTLGGLKDQEGVSLAFSLPSRAPGSLLGSRAGSSAL